MKNKFRVSMLVLNIIWGFLFVASVVLFGVFARNNPSLFSQMFINSFENDIVLGLISVPVAMMVAWISVSLMRNRRMGFVYGLFTLADGFFILSVDGTYSRAVAQLLQNFAFTDLDSWLVVLSFFAINVASLVLIAAFIVDICTSRTPKTEVAALPAPSEEETVEVAPAEEEKVEVTPVEEEKMEVAPVEEKPVKKVNKKKAKAKKPTEEKAPVVVEKAPVASKVEPAKKEKSVKKAVKAKAEKPEENKKVSPKPVKKETEKVVLDPIDKEKHVYHLTKEDDGHWKVKYVGGQSYVAMFDVQKDAVAFTRDLVNKYGGTFFVHNSKGKNKGRIQ